MSERFETVVIEVLGQRLEVRCEQGESDKVQAAAGYLNNYIDDTKKDTTKLSKLLINTALNLSHDLLQLKNSLAQLEEKIDAALISD